MSESKKEPRVSQEMIGILGGGATQQAVSQSGDKKRWLDRRLRALLLPDDPSSYNRFVQEDTKSKAIRRATAYLEDVKARLQQVPSPSDAKATGRPAERSPKALAALLNVNYEDGKSLLWVLRQYVKEVVQSLVGALKPMMFWRDLLMTLDATWLPRYMRAEPVYPNEMDEMLAGLTG